MKIPTLTIAAVFAAMLSITGIAPAHSSDPCRAEECPLLQLVADPSKVAAAPTPRITSGSGTFIVSMNGRNYPGSVTVVITKQTSNEIKGVISPKAPSCQEFPFTATRETSGWRFKGEACAMATGLVPDLNGFLAPSFQLTSTSWSATFNYSIVWSR